jgi:hypothetical protein
MKSIKMLALLAASVTAAGCGSDDNTCGDAACPDGAVTQADAGTDGPMLWALSRGTNNYTITKVVTSAATDGCGLGPQALMSMTRPVTFDEATSTISIGAQQGTPAMPSFGSGKVGANMATLMRENTGGDSMCNWHQKDVSMLVLFANDKFTLDVTETETMFQGCTNPPPPTGGMCTSTFQLTFEKL